MLTSTFRRLSGSLAGLVVALGLSAGALAGSMHDHGLHEGSTAPTEVCVFAAGSVLLGPDATAVCPTPEPPVPLRAPAATDAPRTTTVVRAVSARAPPSTPSFPG